MQLNSDFVLDAVTTVLNWDLPDDRYSEALVAQVCLMSGTDADDNWGCEAWDTALNIAVH